MISTLPAVQYAESPGRGMAGRACNTGADMDDMESAIKAARNCNGLDWRDADEITTPSTSEAWLVAVCVLITVAACLAAVFVP